MGSREKNLQDVRMLTFGSADGVMVAGGREGLVGVGGLLTGGGLTFYTCRDGWGCGKFRLQSSQENPYD